MSGLEFSDIAPALIAYRQPRRGGNALMVLWALPCAGHDRASAPGTCLPAQMLEIAERLFSLR
jgi:hypothetical protein